MYYKMYLSNYINRIELYKIYFFSANCYVQFDKIFENFHH